jgi:hypothetical protein
MHLSDDASRELVSYLVGSKLEESSTLNFSYQVYSGSWDKLPKFDTLTSKQDGQATQRAVPALRYSRTERTTLKEPVSRSARGTTPESWVSSLRTMGPCLRGRPIAVRDPKGQKPLVCSG